MARLFTPTETNILVVGRPNGGLIDSAASGGDLQIAGLEQIVVNEQFPGITLRTHSYEHLIVDAAPIAYWRLNESAGATVLADRMGNYHHPLANQAWIDSATFSVPGIQGGHGITAPAGLLHGASTTSISLNDFTAEGWWYPTSSSTTNRYMFGRSNAGSIGWRLIPRGTGSYWGLYLSGAETHYQASHPVLTNQWVHWVAVRQADTMTMYFNGVPVPTAVLTAVGTGTITRGVALMQDATTANSLGDATFTELALYDRALGAAEILAHYNEGIAA